MGFYEQISSYYDYIFPLSSTTVLFHKDLFKKYGVSTVLDVACGSGAYVQALMESGFVVYGTDLDPAMVKKAGQKTDPQRIRAGDMQMAASIFDIRFDAALCIGNSLVHLTDEEAIFKTLKEFNRSLVSGGVVSIQIINYDRILIDKVPGLPTIVNVEVGLTFTRRYEQQSDGLIHFMTELTVPEGTFKNSIPLYPLIKDALQGLLEDTGFVDLAFYGDFKATPWQPNAYTTIVSAVKP